MRPGSSQSRLHVAFCHDRQPQSLSVIDLGDALSERNSRCGRAYPATSASMAPILVGCTIAEGWCSGSNYQGAALCGARGSPP